MQQAIGAYHAENYVKARAILTPLAQKTNENFVLANLRLGSVALAQEDLDGAEVAFLRAYEVMNSVGLNNGGRSLGAAVVNEHLKVWKGEPFERAMANYYLGVLYYQRHDYNNARAAFQNALFKLRDYGEGKDADRYQEQESEFVAAQLMLARCWKKLDRQDQAQRALDRVRQLRPDLVSLAESLISDRVNCLLVVDYGHGPQVDVAYGACITLEKHGRPTEVIQPYKMDIIGFGPIPEEAGTIPPLNLQIDATGVSSPVLPTIDLLALAAQRKWQDIDTVRVLRRGTSDALLFGAALAASGPGVLAVVGYQIINEPDTRQWGMLPRTTFLVPLELPPGHHNLTVSFAIEKTVLQKSIQVLVTEHGEASAYLRLCPQFKALPFKWQTGCTRQVAGLIEDAQYETCIKNLNQQQPMMVQIDNRTSSIRLEPRGFINSSYATSVYLPQGYHVLHVTALATDKLPEYSFQESFTVGTGEDVLLNVQPVSATPVPQGGSTHSRTITNHRQVGRSYQP